MILEDEVIEQIADEREGRPLAWVCGLVRTLGRDDPLTLLEGMWKAGKLRFTDVDGGVVPSWQCREMFRNNDESSAFRVVPVLVSAETDRR